MIKSGKYIFILFFSITILNAQNPSFKFEELSSKVDFPNTSINDILQDQQGFIWFATWTGLIKYDGYSIKMYRQEPGNANGLKGNKVTCLFEDRENNLWVGTNYTGLYRYDREQDNFIQYLRDEKDRNSLSNNDVWAIFEDSNGFMWIGTQNGLNRLDVETGTFKHYFNKPNDSRSISNNFVYAITETKEGVWVGTEEGLNRIVFNKTTGKEYFNRYELSPKGVPNDDYLAHNFIYKIHPSQFHENTLWVCTSIGLKKVNYLNENSGGVAVQHFGHHQGGLSHRFVPDIWEQNETKVWIATYDGLNLLDQRSEQIQYFNKGIPAYKGPTDNIITCLAPDKQGNLWVGLESGANKLKLAASSFQVAKLTDDPLADNNLISLAVSRQYDGVWAGDRGGGLHFIPIGEEGPMTLESRQFNLLTPKMADLANFVSYLTMDHQDRLWIATHGAGIIRVQEKELLENKQTSRSFEQFTKSDRLSDDYVMSLHQSYSKNIWIGYWDKGIDRYDPLRDTFYRYLVTTDLNINLEAYPVVKLLETYNTGQQFLWVGTRGNGVLKLSFDPENNELNLIKHYQHEEENKNSLSNNFISGFLLDKDNRLWIITENGLNILDEEKNIFKVVLEDDGLLNNSLVSLLEDEEGKVWVSSDAGLSSILFEDNNIEIQNYNLSDGFDFNTDACTISSSGHFIYGGVNGVTHFNPFNIQRDTVTPKIVINDFKVFNKSIPIGKDVNGRTILSKNISETSSVELNHNENVITLGFVGLETTDPSKIKYAYKLEGFVDEWAYTDASQRIAHYTNLPYDELLFKVKASNADGIWSKPTSLQLVIRPPFWLTGWAYFLYASLFAGLLYGALRITRMRAELRHSLELERVEKEKIEEVNKLKLQFFTNISHELRTPLTLIVSPLEQLIQEKQGGRKMQNMFSRMHVNANRLLAMINQLLDIRKDEAGLMKLQVEETDLRRFSEEVMLSFKSLARQKGIQLDFESEVDRPLVWIDPQQFEKVVYNLLSNAIKFTPEGGSVRISISKENNQNIRVEFTDTGSGMPNDQLPYIFDRFYQVEKGQDWNKKGGTGIGLALVKSIVEKHNGQVIVKSEVGKGTTFALLIRTGKTHFSKAEIAQAGTALKQVEHYIAADKIGTPIIKEGRAESDEKGIIPTIAGASTDRPSLLLVEDNEEIRSYLKENLEAEYTIQEAADGQEGYEKAINNPPELIIADIAMPRMDGIEMCSRIKSDIQTSHVPVILLTARTSLVFKIDGIETGADDYITKPFNLRLLKARIQNLIKSRRKLRKKFSKSLDLKPTEVAVSTLDEKLIEQIKFVVEKHMDDSGFTVELLAAALNLSRMQLYRKMKALTGKSPNSIIRSIRMQRAVQLLKTGQYNISEVTYQVGYNDLKSFREQFKKEFGVSPSAYRE